MIVEINGVKYQSVERKRARIPKISPFIMATLAIGALGGFPGLGESQTSDADLAYLSQEYELIQNKKSRLSSNHRKSIIWQFEYHFNKIENL